MAVLNDTDLVACSDLVLTRDGERRLTVLKATFVLPTGDDELRPLPAAAARPIRLADEPWGDPLTTPTRYPSDLAPHKLGTDVVVVAKGHAPGGAPAPSFDVAVAVGPLSRSLRVFGARVWQHAGSRLSAPLALTEQELRYDAAWGGTDLSDPGRPVSDRRNPVGRGVVSDPRRLTDTLAPCIEDPADPIRSVATSPAPAGVGALGPHWHPRCLFVGSYDEQWRRLRAPLPPADQDDRHFQCASPGLLAKPYLRGGEPIALHNLVPGGGTLELTLPALHPVVVLAQADRRTTLRPPLDTVVIDTLCPPRGAHVLLELGWRALSEAPRRLASETVEIRLEPPSRSL
jgi:hypothetical protein